MSTVTAVTAIAAVAALIPDPTTTTIAMVTAITVITAARLGQSNGRDDIDDNGGHIDQGDHGCSSDTRRSARAAAARLAGGRSSRPACRTMADIRPFAIRVGPVVLPRTMLVTRDQRAQYFCHTRPLSLGCSDSESSSGGRRRGRPYHDTSRPDSWFQLPGESESDRPDS